MWDAIEGSAWCCLVTVYGTDSVWSLTPAAFYGHRIWEHWGELGYLIWALVTACGNLKAQMDYFLALRAERMCMDQMVNIYGTILLPAVGWRMRSEVVISHKW